MIARFAHRSRWLLCAALVCGCQRSPGTGRLAIGGTVTRAGAPMSGGMISFRPARGGTGPAATTGIHAGRYQFDSTNGPVSGSHQVVILSALEGKRTAVPAAGTNPTDGAAAPWTVEIDVPSDAPNEIPFDIP